MAHDSLNMIHGQESVLGKYGFIEQDILAQARKMINPFIHMTSHSEDLQSKGAIVTRTISSIKEGKVYDVAIHTTLKGSVIANNDSIYGTGEQLDTLETSMSVERFRKSVHIPTLWEASGSKMVDTMTSIPVAQRELAEYFTRHEVQQIYDTLCGFKVSTSDNHWDRATNILTLAGGIDRSAILHIENAAMRGHLVNGAPTEIISPMSTWSFNDIAPHCYVLILPNIALDEWKESAEWLQLASFDERGATNMVFGNSLKVLSRTAILTVNLANSKILNVAQSTGANNTREIGFTASAMNMIQPGLRVQDKQGLWLGEEGFDYENIVKVRGLLLGFGALARISMGGIAYKVVEPNRDDASALDSSLIMGMKKVQWRNTSGTKDDQLLQTDYDINMMQVDIPVSTQAFPRMLQKTRDAAKTGIDYYMPSVTAQELAEKDAKIAELQAQVEALQAQDKGVL